MSGDRTWPENAEPTPEQWVAWFISLDSERQGEVAGQVLSSAREASRCFMEDHRGEIEMLRVRSRNWLEDALLADLPREET